MTDRPSEVAARVATGAATIAAVTMLARLAGFARILVFARTVGPTCLGDVYTTANTVPNIVFDIVAGGALSSLVVPVLASRFATEADDEAAQIVAALMTWSLLLLVPVALAGALLAHPLMSLLVGSGHAGCVRSREVTIGGDMLEIFAPQILLYGMGVILTGVLQSRQRFFTPALAPLLSSLGVTVSYLIYRQLAIGNGHLSTSLHSDTLVLAVGTTLGVVLLALPLTVPALRGLSIRRPTLRFPPGVGVGVFRLAISGIAVLASQQLATAVVLRLANSDGIGGSVVVYTLSWTVFLLPWAVLAVPVATSAFPALSVAWQQGDTARYRRVAGASSRVSLLLTVAAAGAMAAAAPPAARVVVLGAPGHLRPDVLARAIVAFAPGLVGYGLFAVLSRIRYARGDPKSPAIAAAAGWAVTVVVDLAVVPHVSAAVVPTVLGAGVSVGVTVSALLLAGVAWRDIENRSAGSLLHTLVVSGTATVLAVGIGHLLAPALSRHGIGLSLLGAAVEAAICVALVAVAAWSADRATVRLVTGALRGRRG